MFGAIILFACEHSFLTQESGMQLVEYSDWLIMYYVDADNDLEENLLADLNEIESVDFSNTDITVIALVDRIDGYSVSDGNWENTRAFKIGYDINGYNNSLAFSDRLAIPSLGITKDNTSAELNMGDPATLEKFITFCRTNYKADKNMLLMSNHGGGWRDKDDGQDLNGVQRAISQDKTSNNDALYMSEVREAIKNGMEGEKFDIIAMDACLMGMVEVGSELKYSADILIASSQNIPEYGFPYTQIMKAIASSTDDLTPNRFAQIIVDQFYNTYTFGGHVENPLKNAPYFNHDYSLSAIDLTRIKDVVSAVDDLGASLIGNYTNAISRLQSISFNTVENVDIYDFCHKEGGTSANQVKAAIDSAVLYHKAGRKLDNTHGLGIYFPINKNIFDYDYSSSNIVFAANAPRWISFLQNQDPSNTTDSLEIVSSGSFIGNDSINASYSNRMYGTMLISGLATNSYIYKDSDKDWFYIDDSTGDFNITLSVPSSCNYNILLFGLSRLNKMEIIRLNGLKGGVGENEEIMMKPNDNYKSYFIVVSSENSYSLIKNKNYTICYTDNDPEKGR